ncbi:MAG: N-acetyltransferase family protein [Arenibacterium sp.]
MIIRTARPDDAEGICAIHNPIIAHTDITFTQNLREPASVATQIAERGPAFLVAEAPHGVLGFATYGAFRDGPGYAATREHTIYLEETARGQGTGARLMSHLEESARSEGIHVLVAGLSHSNPAGIAFHRRIGFFETAKMPEVGRKFGRWLDLILMQKTL